jgi:hypothetical protein
MMKNNDNRFILAEEVKDKEDNHVCFAESYDRNNKSRIEKNRTFS